MPSANTVTLWWAHAQKSENPADWQAQSQAVAAEVEPLHKSLDNVKPDDERSQSFYLTERTCQALTPFLERVRTGQTIAALQSARINVRGDTDAESAEWFTIWPSEWCEIDVQDEGYISVRADRIKGRVPLRRNSEAVMASQVFVDFVRAQQMTGLDFIWCDDKGKYAATQWYVVISPSFAGRGVDHPWFDPSTRGQYKQNDYMQVQPTDPAWLIGVSEFTVRQTRVPLPPTDPPELAQLFAQLREIETTYECTCQSRPRLLREYLPKTDFGFIHLAYRDPDDNDSYRTVRLVCSAAARRTLIEGRMAQPADFEAIDVVDAPPEGTAIFDRADAPLPGPFVGKQFQKIRAREAKARAKYEAKPKPPAPVKPVELKKILPKLKRLLKKQDAEVAKGAPADVLDAAEQKLGRPIPARWRELLSLIDGFTIDNSNAIDGTAEVRIAGAKELPSEHESSQDVVGGYGEIKPPPTHLLGVGSTDLGDPIVLDTSKLTPDGDCPVLHVDHETIETVMTWPAISLFLVDAIEVSDDE